MVGSAAVTMDEFSPTLDLIMHGAVDMHVHFGPDVRPENLALARRLDALETVHDAEKAGMAAIVLKAHYWPTAGLARVLQPLVPNLHVFGMTVLNYQEGDVLNPFHAEVAARLGCRIVMGPTTHSRSDVEAARRAGAATVFGARSDQEGISLIDERGKMVRPMQEILDLAQQFNQVVATGHVRRPEDRVLVEEANRRGLRTILSHLHPDRALVDERKWMLDHGAVVEWGWNAIGTLWGEPDVDFRELIDEARSFGVDRCCMTTDSGQILLPPPSESFREFAGRLIVMGMDPAEVRTMAQQVPAELLGLGPEPTAAN
jgi:hypothetical protein